MVDYFAVLGLTRSATHAEMREAYRRLAKLYHPDSQPAENRDTPGRKESDQRMQAINEAKSVLFDPIKREEHRVMLGLREKISAERLAQLRAQTHYRAVTTYRPPQPKRPSSKWDRVWRKWLTGIVSVMCLAVLGVLIYEMSKPAPQSGDPIKELIARYSQPEKLPFDTAPAPDTMTVANDSLSHLRRRGDILFGLGEYRAASKYYEKCLRVDSTDETLITNLSFAYFKRGRYAQSLEVLSRRMTGDSNLVVAYYNIGQLFMHEDKPFDARSAFQAALKVADHMRSEGRTPPPFITNARSELARLE